MGTMPETYLEPRTEQLTETFYHSWLSSRHKKFRPKIEQLARI
jgi:hypothetical protein